MERKKRDDFEIDLRRAQPTGEEGSDEMASAGPMLVMASQARGSIRLAALTGTVGLLIGLLVGAVLPFDLEMGLRLLVGGLVGLLAGAVTGFIGGAFQTEADGDVDDIARDPEFKDTPEGSRSTL